MPPPCPIPADWAEAIAAILDGPIGRVLVLGPVDAGKSTFCRLLLRAAVGRGRPAALIDADVGQKSVGPPAALTRAAADAPERLAGLAFVGATDPVAGFARILAGLGRLLDAGGDELLVVNTSGLLAGAGRRLKAGKIARVAPDLLVAIGQHPALDAVLADHPAIPRLRLGTSPEARRKSAARRRAARRDAFRAHFAGAASHDLALPEPVLSALSDRLLVGVSDVAGRDLALGLVEGTDPARGTARLLSPAPPGAIAGLLPGSVRLDESWESRPAPPPRAAATGPPEGVGPAGRVFGWTPAAPWRRLPAMFDGFSPFRIDTTGATIAGVTGGDGPPLLLLHGNPQTHVMWHKIAPALARRFTVVAADLRGYGASSKPPTTDDHAPYSKRAMAADMVEVMEALGHRRFMVGAHDRGARVAHRMAADHPGAVSRLALLDIAPTREMYAGTTDAFARAYWHWFFMIQRAPLPEMMMGADPRGFWLTKCGSGSAGLSPFTPEALEAYLAAFTPEMIHASCEDYRAAATIDIAHDESDRDGRLGQPVLALWGADGAVGRCFDVLALWRLRAADVRGEALPGGHYLAEELPDEVERRFIEFFTEDAS